MAGESPPAFVYVTTEKTEQYQDCAHPDIDCSDVFPWCLYKAGLV
jgi:hypothetical protein